MPKRHSALKLGSHCGGLHIEESLGFAGLVGVADNGDSGEEPGEHVGLGVADECAFGVVGVEDADRLPTR